MNATLIHRFDGSVGGKAERNQAPKTTAKIGADGTHFQERPPPMFSSGKHGPGVERGCHPVFTALPLLIFWEIKNGLSA
jgi:hypothetical protein